MLCKCSGKYIDIYFNLKITFCSFYLRDIQHEYDGLLSLGHFVAEGSRIG